MTEEELDNLHGMIYSSYDLGPTDVRNLIFGFICASQEYPEWGKAWQQLLKEAYNDDDYSNDIRTLVESLPITNEIQKI